jgi:DNA-binding transcriptional ArsR family regulator
MSICGHPYIEMSRSLDIHTTTLPAERRVTIDEAARDRAADCLRVIAHPVRLRLIELLLAGEYSVGELARTCDAAPHVVSEHLSLMRDRGLLGCERRGRCKYYRVEQPLLGEIIRCIAHRFGKAES